MTTPNTSSTGAGGLVRNILFWAAIALILFFFLFPLYWMVVTSLKIRAEATVIPPKFIPWVQFEPTTDNYDRLFGEVKVSEFGTATRPSEFPNRLQNSLVVNATATFTAVILGTLAAYAFSRFAVPGKGDLMFFILSTRMLPPVVVVIPIFLMFTKIVNLRDTFLGIALIYTTAGLPFVVWMMKGFFDEIPREYEEAAMLDGYSRLEAVWKIVIPEAIPPMLATAVFVLIVGWNEFLWVQLLNPNEFTTVPPFLYGIIGYGRVEWGRMAATSTIFVMPIVIFTFLVRNHLLRGVTFGAVRR